MKNIKILFPISLLLLIAAPVVSQNITFSKPLKADDYRNTEFEIIGKLKAGTPSQDEYDQHILIYKNNNGHQRISVYAPDMTFIGNVQLKFLTEGLIGVDFLAFPDHFMMLYQYQKGSYVYCKALLFNGNGQIIKNPEMVDSSKVGNGKVKSRIYSMVRSDNRNRMLIYKINQDSDFNNIFYTFLYDNRLKFLRNSRLTLPMKDRRSFLSEFHLSNKGLFYFIKARQRNKNSRLTQADLIIKRPLSDTFSVHAIPLKDISIGKVKLKLDHKNSTIYSAAFYVEGRRGDVAGLFTGKFSLTKKKFTKLETRPFDKQLLENANEKGKSNDAFNDYYIRDLTINGVGGFLITAEQYYTSSNYNGWGPMNGWYGRPMGISPYYYPGYSSMYYSPFSPYYYNPYGRRQQQNNVYHYKDVAILSYDSTLSLTWSNFIRKDQESANSASLLSYKMINISSALLFIYNDPYRRSFLLSAMSVSPNGKLEQLPTLQGQDRGFKWMPRYGRQIGSRTVIIPSIYDNYLSFAKIIF